MTVPLICGERISFPTKPIKFNRPNLNLIARIFLLLLLFGQQAGNCLPPRFLSHAPVLSRSQQHQWSSTFCIRTNRSMLTSVEALRSQTVSAKQGSLTILNTNWDLWGLFSFGRPHVHLALRGLSHRWAANGMPGSTSTSCGIGHVSTSGLLVVTFRPEFNAPWVGRPHVTADAQLTGNVTRPPFERLVANKGLPADGGTSRDGIPLFRGNDKAVRG